MSCSNLKIDKTILASTVGAAMVIIIGIVEVDHFLDKKGTNAHPLGIAMFTLGWVLMAILVSINQKTGKFDWNLFLKRGLPALVVFIAASAAQKIITKGDKMSMLGGFVLFMSAWALFASMMVFTEKKNRQERMVLFYGGAALINASMIALFLNRKYNAMSGKWDGPENVFGMGLPMLTLGWVMFAVGISLC